MNKQDVVKNILGSRFHLMPSQETATAFAPSNIALCKYWGKRDTVLNLPVTSSLSLSLGEKGSTTTLTVASQNKDTLWLNGQVLETPSSFYQRLIEYLNLFRQEGKPYLEIKTTSNIPIAAGLASSASGFASLIQALDTLYQWELSKKELSILARLGSGSASRSLWQGFVEWHAGSASDGMDSYGEPIEEKWPELMMGLWIVSQTEKRISSREAMQRTLLTSPLYSAWPSKVAQDLSGLKQAIASRDFDRLGSLAESNALTMHATLLSAWPPVLYSLPETVSAMQTIWRLREEGLPLYFTQDAGPNVKLLFLKKQMAAVQAEFPMIEVIG